MTMHKALHLRDDIIRLYVSRKGGGKGLASIDDCVDVTIQGLRKYTKKSKQILITGANKEIWQLRKQKWKEK